MQQFNISGSDGLVTTRQPSKNRRRAPQIIMVNDESEIPQGAFPHTGRGTASTKQKVNSNVTIDPKDLGVPTYLQEEKKNPLPEPSSIMESPIEEIPEIKIDRCFTPLSAQVTKLDQMSVKELFLELSRAIKKAKEEGTVVNLKHANGKIIDLSKLTLEIIDTVKL